MRSWCPRHRRRLRGDKTCQATAAWELLDGQAARAAGTEGSIGRPGISRTTAQPGRPAPAGPAQASRATVARRCATCRQRLPLRRRGRGPWPDVDARIRGRSGVLGDGPALALLPGRITVDNGVIHDADDLARWYREDRHTQADPEQPPQMVHDGQAARDEGDDEDADQHPGDRPAVQMLVPADRPLAA